MGRWLPQAVEGGTAEQAAALAAAAAWLEGEREDDRGASEALGQLSGENGTHGAAPLLLPVVRTHAIDRWPGAQAAGAHAALRAAWGEQMPPSDSEAAKAAGAAKTAEAAETARKKKKIQGVQVCIRLRKTHPHTHTHGRTRHTRRRHAPDKQTHTAYTPCTHG